jgi:hypothetical protein
MPVKYFDATTPQHVPIRYQSKNLSIPQYHILILFWCALVILYDVTGLRPFPNTAKHPGFLGCSPLTD